MVRHHVSPELATLAGTVYAMSSSPSPFSQTMEANTFNPALDEHSQPTTKPRKPRPKMTAKAWSNKLSSKWLRKNQKSRTPRPCSLLTLPTELLQEIGSELPLRELSVLSRTSKEMSAIFLPALYSVASKQTDYAWARLMRTAVGAQKNHRKLVEALCVPGADLDREVGFRMTALGFAVQAGDHEMINLLVSKGAKVNLGDEEIMGLLNLAEDKATFKLLLELGADVDGKCYPSYPLVVACEKAEYWKIDLLLDAGATADVWESGDQGYSALQKLLLKVASTFWYKPRVLKTFTPYLDRLIRCGADINRRATNGHSTMAILVESQCIDPSLFEHVYRRGASITDQSYNLLFGAIFRHRHGHPNGIDYFATCTSTSRLEFLLDKGVDMDDKNLTTGDTILHTLASGLYYGERTDVVKLLLERGASVNIRNTAGKTAVELADARKASAMVRQFVDMAGDRMEVGLRENLQFAPRYGRRSKGAYKVNYEDMHDGVCDKKDGDVGKRRKRY